MSKYIVGGDRWVRVRMSPDLNAPVVFGVPSGETVDVDSVTGDWAKINFGFSGPRMIQDNDTFQPPAFYMYAALLTPVDAPVPPPPKPSENPTPFTWVLRNALGVNFLFGRSRAIEALSKGCRDFTFMDDWDSARWAADALGKTDAFDGRGTVMFRWWVGHWPSFDELCAHLHLGEDKRIVSIVTNECEGLGGDPVKAIHDHAELDIRVATEAARRGTHVAVGTFPVGNPDITNPAICKAIRDCYAPFWNTFYSRTGIRPVWDQHEYSPDAQHIYNPWEGDIAFLAAPAATLMADYGQRVQTEYVGRNKTPVTRLLPQDDERNLLAPAGGRVVHVYEQDWHETRVKFLFALCGFNLMSGGVLVSSETGIDKGGAGGFIGCGLGVQDIAKWSQRNAEIWQRPVTDEFGHTCAMPKEQACLFQGTDAQNGQGHWGSYYVGGLLDGLTGRWGRQV